MEKDLLYRFFEGHASSEEIKEVKAWVEESDENYRQFLRERKLFDALLVALPLQSEGKKVVSFRRTALNYSWIRESLKVAAVAIIAVCLTMVWLAKDTDSAQLAMQTITVPAGQRANVILADGTEVWLNAGTTMRYPLSFLSSKREVILDGEAYFDVAHNKSCPFVVHTYAMDVEVLGTCFNVEAFPKQNVFNTSLMQGKVKLVSTSTKMEPVILTPGYKSMLKDGHLEVVEIENYDVYRWKEGLYCFRDKAFADIMQDLERYYDLHIKIQKPEVARVILTGKFRIAEGLDYLLRVLQADVDFTYIKDTEKNIIYIR